MRQQRSAILIENGGQDKTADRSRTKVIQYGLGSIGIACARAVAATPGLRLVGAVEVDPSMTGRPLASVLGVEPALLRGITVSPTLAGCLRRTRAGVAMHTTLSSLASVLPQIKECLESGLAVVSSTEELAFPSTRDPGLAACLDRIARREKRAVIGTGVNPGFVMDLIPIAASAASRNVRRILIRRVLDAGTRRASFQKKVGVGMTPAQARRKLAEGSMGHVGLAESALLVARACGLAFDEMRPSGGPVTASRPMRSALGSVARGRVTGLRQSLSCRKRGRGVLRLEMLMALGAEDPRDETIIEGDPPLHLRFEGGVPGDSATIATLVNAIPRALAAPPGLHTILDLPVPHTFGPKVGAGRSSKKLPMITRGRI